MSDADLRDAAAKLTGEAGREAQALRPTMHEES